MDSIKQKLQDPETITRFFLDTPKQLVRRLTFFDETQYGDGINLYFISKKTCTDAAQALCTAWLLEYLWEEDNEKFVFSEENCKETADYYIRKQPVTHITWLMNARSKIIFHPKSIRLSERQKRFKVRKSTPKKSRFCQNPEFMSIKNIRPIRHLCSVQTNNLSVGFCYTNKHRSRTIGNYSSKPIINMFFFGVVSKL
jgi:hypothetical protein